VGYVGFVDALTGGRTARAREDLGINNDVQAQPGYQTGVNLANPPGPCGTQIAQGVIPFPGFDIGPLGDAPDLGLEFSSSAIDSSTQSQIEQLVDLYDSNGGRLPDWINRGGGSGNVFENRPTNGQTALPQEPYGYYHEADVWPLQPNSAGTAGVRGEERLVFGNDGEVYYTNTHYQTFVRVR
jgi:hypothetical protein